MKSGPHSLSREEEHDLGGIGGRITRFRRLRHLTQTELARRVGMRPGPVNAIEHGRNRPTLAVAVRLAKVLDVPLDALLSDAAPPYVREAPRAAPDASGAARAGTSTPCRLQTPIPNFTSGAATPMAQLIRLVPATPAYPPAVLATLEELAHAFLCLEDLCHVPKRAAIPLRLAMPRTEAGIEDFALRVRGLLGIGPGVIFDYLELLENAGLRIVFCRLPVEIQSAACYDAQSDNAFLFVSTNPAMNTERRLFRLIFELGRIYCFTGEVRQVEGRKKPLDAEHVAAKFAAFFLMPAEAVHATVRQVGVAPDRWTWELLLRLKHRFGVSAQTFLYRLDELDLIAPKTKAELDARITAHYAATHHAEPDGSRRILSPNGRLGDLLLVAESRARGNPDLKREISNLKSQISNF